MEKRQTQDGERTTPRRKRKTRTVNEVLRFPVVLWSRDKANDKRQDSRTDKANENGPGIPVGKERYRATRGEDDPSPVSQAPNDDAAFTRQHGRIAEPFKDTRPCLRPTLHVSVATAFVPCASRLSSRRSRKAKRTGRREIERRECVLRKDDQVQREPRDGRCMEACSTQKAKRWKAEAFRFSSSLRRVLWQIYLTLAGVPLACELRLALLPFVAAIRFFSFLSSPLHFVLVFRCSPCVSLPGAAVPRLAPKRGRREGRGDTRKASSRMRLLPMVLNGNVQPNLCACDNEATGRSRRHVIGCLSR